MWGNHIAAKGIAATSTAKRAMTLADSLPSFPMANETPTTTNRPTVRRILPGKDIISPMLPALAMRAISRSVTKPNPTAKRKPANNDAKRNMGGRGVVVGKQAQEPRSVPDDLSDAPRAGVTAHCPRNR